MLKKLRDSWLVTSPVIPVVVFLTILYIISLYNWAMFHSLIETTLAILAFSIFAVTWSSRRFVDNSYLVFIGISFLFMGILTILHEVVSAGGKMFSANSTDELTIQTWTAVRYIQSLSFLVAPFEV